MAPHSRLISPLLALGLLAPAGCCDLALWLCGPDQSEWISEFYLTHETAQKTFLEAIRRDDVRVICKSFSSGFLRRYGIPGAFECAVSWQKLRDQMPWIHLLGTASVSEPETVSKSHVRYVLERSGYRFALDLRRLPYWAVAYWDGEERVDRSRYVDSLAVQGPMGKGPYLTIDRSDPDRAIFRVAIPIDSTELPDELKASAVEDIRTALEWKVDNIQQLPDDPPGP